jgi:hypothetical protein
MGWYSDVHCFIYLNSPLNLSSDQICDLIQSDKSTRDIVQEKIGFGCDEWCAIGNLTVKYNKNKLIKIQTNVKGEGRLDAVFLCCYMEYVLKTKFDNNFHMATCIYTDCEYETLHGVLNIVFDMTGIFLLKDKWLVNKTIKIDLMTHKPIKKDENSDVIFEMLRQNNGYKDSGDEKGNKIKDEED